MPRRQLTAANGLEDMPKALALSRAVSLLIRGVEQQSQGVSIAGVAAVACLGLGEPKVAERLAISG